MARTKSLLAAAACAAAVAAVGAGPALAGEVTGNGKLTPIGAAPDTAPHASSICSFSGQNDGEPPAGRTAEHVQNWGQRTKADRDSLATIGFHPGDSCNGHRGFFAGG
jgi:hypothetical protein